MLTVLLSIIVSALAVFGLYCLLTLVMGLRCNEKYMIAVCVRENEYDTHLTAKRAELIFDGNRHIKLPPVILANRDTDREMLRCLSQEYGYEIYVREEADGEECAKSNGMRNG
ncbi:MAG: hypothetical protein IKA74_07140 [Clostridia bacterium]|nr:hypothetical protein [Clostridia bacterium]